MSVRLSQQLSFRWLPEPATSDSDVLVLSVADYFVDLRISKKNGSLDWGFAGRAEVVERKAEHITFRWSHIIDSNGYTEADVGNLPNSPKGDFVETGKAPHPNTGVERSFEERWRTIEPDFVSRFPTAFILQSKDGKAFVSQAGGVFQAMVAGQDGADRPKAFTSRRQLWDDLIASWNVKYETGNVEDLSKLPTADTVDPKSWTADRTIGDEVEVLGSTFIIRALVDLL